MLFLIGIIHELAVFVSICIYVLAARSAWLAWRTMTDLDLKADEKVIPTLITYAWDAIPFLKRNHSWIDKAVPPGDVENSQYTFAFVGSLSGLCGCASMAMLNTKYFLVDGMHPPQGFVVSFAWVGTHSVVAFAFLFLFITLRRHLEDLREQPQV